MGEKEKKRYSYQPLASYEKLKQAETAINASQTLDDLRKAVNRHGPRIGYKAFCYIFAGKMTPEAMKPQQAIAAARALKDQGKTDEASAIRSKVLEFHSGNISDEKNAEKSETENIALPTWLEELA